MAVNSFNAQNPPVTTKGDVFTFSTIPTRLGVGANNTVLTADSTTATGLKWATPAAGPTGWTLLNAGGTALTGAASITISGISSKQLLVFAKSASSASASSVIYVRPNNDTAANYTQFGIDNNIGSTYAVGNFSSYDTYSDGTGIYCGQMGSNAGSAVTVSCFIDLADQTGWKRFIAIGTGSSDGGSNSFRQVSTQGIWEGAASISSITITSNTGNFDNGTVYVLGAS